MSTSSKIVVATLAASVVIALALVVLVGLTT